MIRNHSSLIAGGANTADHSDEKEGYWVTLDANGIPTLGASATAQPKAVIVQGRGIGQSDDLQLMGGEKIVDVRLGGTVEAHTEGMLKNDGTFVQDTGSGARVVACQFLKGGIVGDLVPAILFRGITLS